MAWRFAPLIGLVALLCPVLAKAQTNLDQGKSPSQIFANACVECHKEPHGLGKGRSASALTDFLREHYTTNGQQAAALAAYVLGGRSADTAPATQGRGPKPAADRASVEEPKSNRHGGLFAKPEDRPRHNPAGQAASPAEEQPTIMRPVLTPTTTAHNRRKEKESRTSAPTATTEPDAGTHAPAAAAAEPAPASEPARDQGAPPPAAAAMPAAAATPAEAAPAESGENAPAPRDHIPD